MASVSLNASFRANLSALQDTAALLSSTQARIGSGKKVASAIDDPTAFFTAQALTNRSGNLTSRLDGIAKGINTVKAASAGISGITALLKQAKGIATDARALATTGADTERTAASTKYAAIMSQVNSMAKDSGYDGVNLLASDSLTVQFAEKTGSSTLALTGFSGAAGGAVITATATSGTWTGAGNAAIDTDIAKLETSMTNLETQSKDLASNLATMTTRQSFVKEMSLTLRNGADDLTNADLNAESANMLALNTQHSLAINSLSLASQASQGVLKLLG